MMRPQCDCCGYLIYSWGTPGSVREVKTRDLDDKGWEFGGQFCELCFAKAFKNLGWDFDEEDMKQIYEERGDDVNPRTGKPRRNEDLAYAIPVADDTEDGDIAQRKFEEYFQKKSTGLRCIEEDLIK